MSEILSGIPIWVYGVFFGLMYFGYTQTKQRFVSRTRLTIVPAVLMALSFYGVWKSPHSHVLAILVWLAAVRVAFALSVYFEHGKGVIPQPDGKTLLLPGSWVPIGIFLSIFVTRFAMGYAAGTHLVEADSMQYILVHAVVSGLISGTFMARARQILSVGKRTTVVPTLNINSI